MDCCGYLRVSTDRQAGEKQTSLADQQRAIEGLAAKLGRSVERWYRDEGASGATVEKRPQLRALLADCLAEPRPRTRPGYVLVLNDSRWGRFPNPDQAAALRFQLDQAGWLVRFVEGDESEDPTFRHVMRAIGGAQASEYRRNVQRNARRGSRGIASQGYWGTRAPYGYRRAVVYPPGRERVLEAHQRKAPDEKVALRPHDAEAAIVRELFRRYATGTESIASLATWAREAEPRRHWSARSVVLTLTNPAYVGDVVSGRYSRDASGKLSAPHPESEWIVTRDAHPALIDRDTFARCQDVLARNAKWTTRVRTDWIVSGIVFCRCGKPYVAGGGNKNLPHRETRSYRCATKAGIMTDRCPYPGTIKKEWLERAVVETVASVVSSPKVQRHALASLDRRIDALRRAPLEAAAVLERSIAEATARRDRLVQAVAEDTITAEEAKGQLTELRRLLARLERQRDAMQGASADRMALDAERARYAALASEFGRAAKTLEGPALRELIRPWIAGAAFDAETRELTIEVRHVPALTYGALTSMACPPDQKTSATSNNVTRRVVRVGGAR